VLVGRTREQARLSELLAEARLGRSQVLVLRGPAGIGKSALLDHSLQEAHGFQLLHVVGTESEADLPYAGLHALLRPLIGPLEAVPEGQRSALRVALALESGAAPDRLAVAAGTLTLLAEAAEQAPLLVVIDDAHWLDRSSTDALTFAARRLRAETIVVLFAARTGERRSFRADGLPELELQPLAEKAALALLRERFGTRLNVAVAERLARTIGGNPLALVELPALLSEEERLGQVPLREPLPVSEAVEQRVHQALRALPDSTRRALLLAAADEQAPLEREALAPAEDEGLVRFRSGSVAFRHPLFRAAVYHAASPEERRSAHRELANHFSAEEDADRRAWHQAAAADGPDEAVATALASAASRFAERGGHASVSRALERAAELSPDDDIRARRLIAAAEAAQAAGFPERALELAERARIAARDPLARIDAAHVRWLVQANRGIAVDQAAVERQARALVAVDPLRAAKLLGLCAIAARTADFDLRRAAALLQEATSLCEEAGSEVPAAIREMLAHLSLLLGRATQSELMILEEESERRHPWISAHVWLERFDARRAELKSMLERFRSRGNVLMIADTAWALADLEWRVANFAAARAAGTEALDLAEATGWRLMAAEAHFILAVVAASQGRESEARAHAELTENAFSDRPRASLPAGLALGLLELGLGRPEAAIGHLRPVSDLVARSGAREPGVFPNATDLIEAYARVGDHEAAEDELERLAEKAHALSRRWALAAVARLRGFLAPHDGFDEHFRAALALHEAGAGSPFDRARTELLYGERLRRAKRKTEARQQLRAAIGRFDDLGAASWSERARAELKATGARIARRDPTAPEKLTPQELQVALLVAEGKTNPEVGAALFLSRKTVEYHLTHIYRKLQFHSRAELIQAFGSPTAERDAAAAEVMEASGVAATDMPRRTRQSRTGEAQAPPSASAPTGLGSGSNRSGRSA
jgi:DNA-binding CsgD family transcriptional regulator